MFVAHFEDMQSSERTVKPSAAVVGRAKNILKYLLNYNDVQFLHFMCDAFEPLAVLSLKFQTDDITVCQAVQAQETCYLNLVGLQTDLGPKQRFVVQSMVQTDKYQGRELRGYSFSTLEEERKVVTGKLVQ